MEPTIPGGWTDDMTLVVPEGRTLDELVESVFRAAVSGENRPVIVHRIVTDFGITQADAELALDRVCGGAVRAATGQKVNRPRRDKDPVAWISYQRCLKHPELIASLYPQFADRTGDSWWRRLFSWL